MAEWAAKRFWKSVSVDAIEGGFGIALDGRPLKTPKKHDFALPSAQLAQLVAQEWDAVDQEINPNLMPYTRACNAAIEDMPQRLDAVIDMLAEYGETDLLCYRATTPQALIERQAAVWDPILNWAKTAHGIDLAVTQGVLPIPQDPASIAIIKTWIARYDAFAMMGLHDMTIGLGSIILIMALVDGKIDADAAWDASRIDEAWQMEQWGQDSEALQAAARKRAELDVALSLFMAVTREGQT